MQHTDLQHGRWSTFTLAEQMANIGSEVFRALQWNHKNKSYANAASIRALELFDLTLKHRTKESELKEIARARELWLDFFIGNNQYNQTEELWKRYFFAFTSLARKNH